MPKRNTTTICRSRNIGNFSMLSSPRLYKKLVTGGRACINIANLGRKPYIPLHSYIIEDMLTIGYHMRGEIIWDKASSAGSSTAWGSWLSAANPVLRDVHEYILVFSKDAFSRKRNGKRIQSVKRTSWSGQKASGRFLLFQRNVLDIRHLFLRRCHIG